MCPWWSSGRRRTGRIIHPEEQPVPVQFSTQPFYEGEEVYSSLNELSQTICGEHFDNFDAHFGAFGNGVYLREGLKPFLPMKAHTRVENERDIPLLPDAQFVGLFAVGIRCVLNLNFNDVTKNFLAHT